MFNASDLYLGILILENFKFGDAFPFTTIGITRVPVYCMYCTVQNTVDDAKTTLVSHKKLQNLSGVYYFTAKFEIENSNNNPPT
jgi:hypothetical protein